MGNSALLAAPKVEKETEGNTNGNISWGACSMQGWRRSMEDAHAGVLDIGGAKGVHYFAVFDGHGGAEVAEYCGKHLHDELVQHAEFKDGGDIGKAIGETFVQMDEKIVSPEAKNEMLSLDDSGSFSSSPREGDAPATSATLTPPGADLSQVARSAAAAAAAEAAQQRRDWEPHSGCTAVAAVVWGSQVFVGNAGDSRCVVCDSNGKAIPLSFDHKPEDAREQARIYAAGAVVEMGRVSSRHTSSALNLTRAIGDLDFKKNPHKGPKEQAVTAWPDIKTLELDTSDHEFMILACDGIWDCLDNQQAVDFVRARLPKKTAGEKVSVSWLSEIGAEMCDHCLAADTEGDCLGTDNMTVMVVLLRGAALDVVNSGVVRAGEGTAEGHADKKRRVSGGEGEGEEAGEEQTGGAASGGGR